MTGQAGIRDYDHPDTAFNSPGGNIAHAAKECRMAKLALAFVCFVVGATACWVPPCEASSAPTSASVRVLKKYYRDEKALAVRYETYSRKAEEEGLPNIARLFIAFSRAEAVHALNAKTMLKNLGATVDDSSFPTVTPRKTQKNLADAVALEIAEIEKIYPKQIVTLGKEKNLTAIEALGYHWEAEKRHLDTLEEIRDHTGFTFFLLVDKIESNRVKYFICRVCGLIVLDLSPAICAVCRSPGTVYFDSDAPRTKEGL